MISISSHPAFSLAQIGKGEENHASFETVFNRIYKQNLPSPISHFVEEGPSSTAATVPTRYRHEETAELIATLRGRAGSAYASSIHRQITAPTSSLRKASSQEIEPTGLGGAQNNPYELSALEDGVAMQAFTESGTILSLGEDGATMRLEQVQNYFQSRSSVRGRTRSNTLEKTGTAKL
jgi:hypothetical protein